MQTTEAMFQSLLQQFLRRIRRKYGDRCQLTRFAAVPVGLVLAGSYTIHNAGRPGPRSTGRLSQLGHTMLEPKTNVNQRVEEGSQLNDSLVFERNKYPESSYPVQWHYSCMYLRGNSYLGHWLKYIQTITTFCYSYSVFGNKLLVCQ